MFTVKETAPQYLHIEKAVLSRMCIDVDSPRSLMVFLLLKYEEWDQLADMAIDPMHYSNAILFQRDYLVSKYLTKFPSLPLERDREGIAWSKFNEAEMMCCETNRRILSDPRMGGLSSIIDEACKIIRKVLPPLAPTVVTSDDGFVGPMKAISKPIAAIESYCRWGPGVTSSCKGAYLGVDNKLRAPLEATSALKMAGVHNLVNAIPAWAAYHGSDGFVQPSDITTSAGNAIAFVPKTAKTDRVIAIEPHLNAFVQRGVGIYIRNRLARKLNVDLRSQERNQLLAKAGSLTGKLATLDLSSASDTISKEIVNLLLPYDWCFLLDVLRSERYKHGAIYNEYHKHSSMGNGYTFELETLIFTALAHSVANHAGISTDEISIYGDDIIVPVDIYKTLCETLNWCGFVVNTEKSFATGPFRESCGKDYFLGVDVRPVFLKESLTSVPALYRCFNSLQSIKHVFRDPQKVLGAVCFFIPRNLRFPVPQGYESNGLVTSFTDAIGRIRVDRPSLHSGWENRYVVEMLVFEPATKRKPDDTLAVSSALFSMTKPDKLIIDEVLTIDRTITTAREIGKWRRRAQVIYWAH